MFRGSLGEYRQAIEDYDKALKLSPSKTLTYRNRGLTYKRLGEYRPAIEDYDKAIDLEPSSYTSYFDRGLIYKEMGETRLAINDLNKALTLTEDQEFRADVEKALAQLQQ